MVKSLIPVSLSALLLLTSCDMVRKLAGRPTSDDLEIKKLEMINIKENLRHEREAVTDTVRNDISVADSLAKTDSLEKANAAFLEKLGGQERGTLLNPAALGGLFTTDLDYHYYVIVGAFKERANAEKMLGIVNEAGYVGTMIAFRNGLNAIGLCQTDDLNKAFQSRDKVSQESFCPDDVWILVNE